jgi:hypothetical protein
MRSTICKGFLGLALSLLSALAAAQLTVAPIDGATVTPNAMANALLGSNSGISITNVTYTGANGASGTFGGGLSNIGLVSGILLTTGSVNSVIGPNNSDSTGVSNSLPGDVDLTAFAGAPTHDASVLNITFVPTGNTVQFWYVFGSEEYNEYVGSTFNDAFGFYVNGTNMALIPGTNTPVTINNVNCGTTGTATGTNCNLFVNNPAGAGTQLDGYTKIMGFTAAVNPNVPNTLKIAIADTSDFILDSAVFIAGRTFYVCGGSGQPACLAVPTCSLTATPSSIVSGGSSTLTATCSPEAFFYTWTGGTCAGTVGPTCVVSPTQTTVYSVTGGNYAGNGNTASATVTVTYEVPGAPTIGTAIAGNGLALVTFSAPFTNGGKPITGYTVTSNPPGGVDTNAASLGLSHLISGLTNGVTYTFTVTATNSVGVSFPSNPTNSVTPSAFGAVPGAPVFFSYGVGNQQITVNFNAPASVGSSAILGYTVTSIPAGGIDTNAGSTSLSHVITGLTNGTPYTFTITAVNLSGVSAPSIAPSTATPVGPPAAPTGVIAVAGDKQANVSFNAPAINGGSPVTNYWVWSNPPGGSDLSPGGRGLNHTIIGLTNGVSYTFTVTARNSNADSAPSAPSNAVTPSGPTPVCSLSLSPSAINAGASATLTATCAPAATSYIWTNSGFGSAVASGTVSPAVTTAYSVAGVNSNGAGNTASAILTVTPLVTCTLSATPNLIAAGGSAYLFASCNPAATSYSWTGSGFAATTAGGKVSPAATTTYTVVGSNSLGSSAVASAKVTVGAAARAEAQALFINASTSTNKTSVLRIMNLTAFGGAELTATAFDENGALLGVANSSLGNIGANQALTFSSADIEHLLGFTPSLPTAKYSVYVYSGLSYFQIINMTQDVATGARTLSQSLYNDRSSAATAASVTRSAWFVSSSTSTNKTNVVRLINTSRQAGSLTASLYDENGNLFGSGNTALGTIAARQMISYTSAQLESAFGYMPASPTAKYRVVFSANLPSLELINFTKDIASGNVALVQAQIDDRPTPSGSSSTRNVLLVNPSTNPSRNTVLRIVNPDANAAAVTVTAYDEAGNVVGSGSLGSVAANQILALTSAQIETAMGYTPSSATAKYRLVINANVPSFEVIDSTKVTSTGNLYLAQAQTDNRAASSGSMTSRYAHIVYPSNNPAATTELRLTNTTSSSAALTATAFSDSGALIGNGAAIGTLGANQTLTLTSAQLETLFGYTPPSASSTWQIVFSASLSNFELVNYINDVATGLLTLAQPQTE